MYSVLHTVHTHALHCLNVCTWGVGVGVGSGSGFFLVCLFVFYSYKHGFSCIHVYGAHVLLCRDLGLPICIHSLSGGLGNTVDRQRSRERGGGMREGEKGNKRDKRVLVSAAEM